MSSNASDPFEFLKKLWAPMGLPMAGAGMPGMMFPSVDIDEIERRISDMRSVETWLSLNLEIVRTTIQAMAAQRSTMQAFQAMHQSATNAAAATEATATATAANAARATADPVVAPKGRTTKRPRQPRKPT